MSGVTRATSTAEFEFALSPNMLVFDLSKLFVRLLMLRHVIKKWVG